MKAMDGDRARALSALGLGAGATDADVDAAYRRLVRRYHPDRAGPEGSTERFIAVVEARRMLQAPATSDDPVRPTAPQPTQTSSEPRAPRRAAGPPIVPGPVRYVPETVRRRGAR